MLAFSLALLLACGPKAPPSAAAAPTGAPLEDAAPPAPPPSPPPPPPSALQQLSSQGMQISWQVEGNRLHCHMSAPTAGWVRFGINSVRSQAQANIILGWVDAEGGHVQDGFANDPPHITPDTELGGTQDATLVSGAEAAGRTEVEFTIPLDSGDAYDIALVPGSMVYLVLSYGPDDNPEHTAVVRTVEQITL